MRRAVPKILLVFPIREQPARRQKKQYLKDPPRAFHKQNNSLHLKYCSDDSGGKTEYLERVRLAALGGPVVRPV